MRTVTHALLLSAGLGTRLRPLTLVRAKPAIPVAGIPIARRIVTWLSDAGIADIVVNLHHLPETITTVLGDGSDLDVRVRYSWEHPTVLGSAGGPRQALDILGVDTFLLVNGDTLTDLAIEPLVDAHVDSGALVTMAVIPNRAPQHYSGLRLADDGAVLGVEPRGSDRPSFHFIGVQVAHRTAFVDVPQGRAANSVGDIFDTLIAARPGSIRAYRCDARFWDIGTVQDYWSTSHAFAASEALRGESAGLDRDARLVDSIAWDDVELGPGAAVTRCILTDGVRVAAGASYADAILMRGHDGQLVSAPLDLEKR
jgi:NDP-sugar pyrophosphorylase family protein